mmetsp:Transcript_20724/g.43570  ORF Transcript_20724/g.43570 Transcript_20724/m.43570 type:complete len:444 (+) Transcript_20724:30-1361(+)
MNDDLRQGPGTSEGVHDFDDAVNFEEEEDQERGRCHDDEAHGVRGGEFEGVWIFHVLRLRRGRRRFGAINDAFFSARSALGIGNIGPRPTHFHSLLRRLLLNLPFIRRHRRRRRRRPRPSPPTHASNPLAPIIAAPSHFVPLHSCIHLPFCHQSLSQPPIFHRRVITRNPRYKHSQSPDHHRRKVVLGSITLIHRQHHGISALRIIRTANHIQQQRRFLHGDIHRRNGHRLVRRRDGIVRIQPNVQIPRTTSLVTQTAVAGESLVPPGNETSLTLAPLRKGRRTPSPTGASVQRGIVPHAQISLPPPHQKRVVPLVVPPRQLGKIQFSLHLLFRNPRPPEPAVVIVLVPRPNDVLVRVIPVGPGLGVVATGVLTIVGGVGVAEGVARGEGAVDDDGRGAEALGREGFAFEGALAAGHEEGGLVVGAVGLVGVVDAVVDVHVVV